MSLRRSKDHNKQARSAQRRFTVRAVRRDRVDMGKLSKALLGLAAAEAERQAQADHAANKNTTAPKTAADSEEQARPTGGAHD
jgi:hypothetical protein